MNGAKNPYRAGLGLDPPVLAGRDRALRAIDGVLEALARYDAAEPLLLTGLVGTGRTAVLRAATARLARQKWAAGLVAVRRGRLGAAIGDAVAQATAQLATRQPGARAVPQLRGAVATYCASTASTAGGALDAAAVRHLLRAAGSASMGSGWGICLLLDDLHHGAPDELVALAEAVCDAADQGWAVGLVGSGLPSVEGRLGPHLRRLLPLGPLDAPAVADAVGTPVGGVGRGVDAESVAAVGALSGGYPLLLQAFAGQAWNEAEGGPITLANVEAGRRHA